MGRTLSSMSQREIEDGGQRFYAAKGWAGENRDGDDYDEDRVEDDDLVEPVEVITERDLHPAHWEGVEGYEPTQDDHDQAELMYVDPAERDYGV